MKKIITIFLLAFVFTAGLLTFELTNAEADTPVVTSESISYGDMIIRTARAGGEAYTGLTLVDTNVKHGNVANNVINKFTTFTAPSDSWRATLGTEGDNAYAYNYKLFTLADDGVIAEIVAKHNVKVTVSVNNVAGWVDPAILSVYKLSGGNLETIKSVSLVVAANESPETLGCEVQLNAGDTMYYEFRFPWTGDHRNLESLPTFNFEYVEGEVVTPDTPVILNESVKYSDVILKTAENAGEMAFGNLIGYGLFYGAVSTSGSQLNKFTTFTVDGNGGATLGTTSDPVYCPNAGQVYYKGLDTGAVLKITALCDVTLDASRNPAYGLGWVANSTLSAYVESNGTFTQILNVDCTNATTAAEFALNDIVLSKGDSLYYVLTFQWDYRNTQNLGQFTFDVEHTHNHSTELSYDAENHWNECSCKDKKNVTNHVWNEGQVTTKPTGTEPGVRTFTCECGQTKTEEIPATGPTDAAVKALFQEYYNNGIYFKDSVLNVNSSVIEEVQNYFHNSQVVRFRKTSYTLTGLTMTISEDGKTYGNESVYSNGNNCVNHTGFGGSWTVTEYASVEDWFVTLKDFADSSISGWTVDGNVYTFELVPTTADFEDEMTRMAREFVAPMWLAPDTLNYNYVSFTKLTVEVVDSSLVMKLYVDTTEEGKLLGNSDLVFSQVTITYPTITPIEVK